MTQVPPPLPDLAPPRGPAVPVWDWLRRHRHVTVPVAIPPAFLAAGAALAGSPQAGVPTAVGAGVLAVSVWWAAPHKWTDKGGLDSDGKPRPPKPRWAEVWYARLSALAAGGWLSAAAFTMLATPVLLAVPPLALAWGIPWWWHKRGRKHDMQDVERWAAWWRYYTLSWEQVHGSEVVNVTTLGVIDTLTIQLRAGRQTLADVKAILPKLESALQGHAAPGMTRAENAARRGDLVLVHLKRANPHDVTVEWDPALAPSSVTKPAPLGKGEDGEWKHGPLLENWFIIGRKRSGKSNEASAMLASWTGCPDAQPPWIVDLKGGRTARPWAQCADWIATTIDEARLLLGCLAAESRARAELWYTGEEQGVPDQEVRALLGLVDEANNVLSTMKGDRQCQDDAATVASEGGAVCAQLWVMTQYGALHESVGSEQTRGNLPARMCFAVSQADHAQFALDDWKNLDASKLENQGEFYYRIAHDEAPAPCRGPEMPHDDVRDIAARNAQIPRSPLRLFCGDQVAYTMGGRDVTWQEVYDTRWDRVPASFRRANLAAAPAPPAVSATAPSPEVPMVAIPPAPAVEPAWAARLREIDDECAAVPDLPAPPPVDEATLRRTMEGRMRLWARLLQDAPDGGVEPKTLNTVMSNSWTHEKLARLAALGYVTKLGRSRYAPVAGCDVWEGLERIKEADDRLPELAGAR